MSKLGWVCEREKVCALACACLHFACEWVCACVWERKREREREREKFESQFVWKFLNERKVLSKKEEIGEMENMVTKTHQMKKYNLEIKIHRKSLKTVSSTNFEWTQRNRHGRKKIVNESRWHSNAWFAIWMAIETGCVPLTWSMTVMMNIDIHYPWRHNVYRRRRKESRWVEWS